MAKKIKETTNRRIIDLFKKGTIIRDICKMLNISNGHVYKVLQNVGLKQTLKELGVTVWNQGLTSNLDKRIAKYAKTKSCGRRKVGKYWKVWSDELNKMVWEHHYVWFKNTGYWPDTDKEQIHHIDLKTDNNEYGNLLLTDVKTHASIHKQYEIIAGKLIEMDFLSIDTNGYITKESICSLIKKLKLLEL